MLTIFSLCEGASAGSRTNACEQRQQGNEQAHQRQERTTKVRHHDGCAHVTKRRGPSMFHPALGGQGGRVRKQGQGNT